MVNIETIFGFRRKREAGKSPEAERIVPLPNLSGSEFEKPSTSIEAVNQAREALKVLRLERQILGSAVTTIYESHSKGVISEVERNRMLERYKVDLKRLEKEIEENQQIVDVHDLEVEREELIKAFQTKVAEIDEKLKGLKSGSRIRVPDKTTSGERSGNENSQNGQLQGSKSNSEQEPVTDSEKRIEQIREEILKAIDRLEQIETEG